MIKKSRQRQAVKDCLIGRYDHPTAEMIYLSVKNDYPNISLGTVYRNLSLLTELGEIQRISTGIGPDRFDGEIKPHCHFQCTRCKKVVDLNFMPDTNFDAEANNGFEGQIESHQIQFFGLCEACK